MENKNKYKVNGIYNILDKLRKNQEKLGVDNNDAKRLCMILSDIDSRNILFELINEKFDWVDDDEMETDNINDVDADYYNDEDADDYNNEDADDYNDEEPDDYNDEEPDDYNDEDADDNDKEVEDYNDEVINNNNFDDNDNDEDINNNDNDDDIDDELKEIVENTTSGFVLQVLHDSDCIFAWGPTNQSQVVINKDWQQHIHKMKFDYQKDRIWKDQAFRQFTSECKDDAQKIEPKLVRIIDTNDNFYLLNNKNAIINILTKNIKHKKIVEDFTNCIRKNIDNEIGKLISWIVALVASCTWQCRAFFFNQTADVYLQNFWFKKAGRQITSYASCRHNDEDIENLGMGDIVKGIVFLLNFDKFENVENIIVQNKWHPPVYFYEQSKPYKRIVMGQPIFTCPYNCINAAGIYLTFLMLKEYCNNNWKTRVATQLLKV